MRFFKIFLLLIVCTGSSFAVGYHGDDDAAMLYPGETGDWLEQKQFFEENGYLWIKNFFSPEQVKLLQFWADDVDSVAQSILKLMQASGQSARYITQNIPQALIVVPEVADPSQVCRAEDLLSCYPDLHHFVEGIVTSYIGRLLGDPYVPFKDKINFKWPGGGAFSPHQDFPAYEFFGPREHVTAMICIDHATLENGCLQVAKNWKEIHEDLSQRNPERFVKNRAVLSRIEGGKDHGSIQPEYVEKISWLALETSPYDLVIFNSFLPHYSEPNNSKSSRRAMFFTHNKLKEGDHRRAYYHAKRNDPENPVFHIGTPTKARGK